MLDYDTGGLNYPMIDPDKTGLVSSFTFRTAHLINDGTLVLVSIVSGLFHLDDSMQIDY